MCVFFHQFVDEHKESRDKSNMLMGALSAMHDKNSQLEEMINFEKMVKRELLNHMDEWKRTIAKQRGKTSFV